MLGQMVTGRIASFQGGSGPINNRGTVTLTLNPIDKELGKIGLSSRKKEMKGASPDLNVSRSQVCSWRKPPELSFSCLGQAFFQQELMC